jgi:hypothetical protein
MLWASRLRRSRTSRPARERAWFAWCSQRSRTHCTAAGQGLLGAVALAVREAQHALAALDVAVDDDDVGVGVVRVLAGLVDGRIPGHTPAAFGGWLMSDGYAAY